MRRENLSPPRELEALHECFHARSPLFDGAGFAGCAGWPCRAVNGYPRGLRWLAANRRGILFAPWELYRQLRIRAAERRDGLGWLRIQKAILGYGSDPRGALPVSTRRPGVILLVTEEEPRLEAIDDHGHIWIEEDGRWRPSGLRLAGGTTTYAERMRELARARLVHDRLFERLASGELLPAHDEDGLEPISIEDWQEWSSPRPPRSLWQWLRDLVR